MAKDEETKGTEKAGPGPEKGQQQKQVPVIPGTNIPYPQLDENWQRLNWSFANNEFVHGAEQLVLQAGDKIAVGFFDPFARKFSPFARFSVVLSKEEAKDLGNKLLEMASKRK